MPPHLSGVDQGGNNCDDQLLTNPLTDDVHEPCGVTGENSEENGKNREEHGEENPPLVLYFMCRNLETNPPRDPFAYRTPDPPRDQRQQTREGCWLHASPPRTRRAPRGRRPRATAHHHRRTNRHPPHVIPRLVRATLHQPTNVLQPAPPGSLD